MTQSLSGFLVSFHDFAAKYCETQKCTPLELLARLRTQALKYEPDGWFMAEAQVMDSSWFGQRIILPYGPKCTFKEVPTTPFSPRGLASDTSVVIAVLPRPESLE